MCINIKVSYFDVCGIADLNWGDIQYAIENNFFELNVAITHAENVLEHDISDDLVFELAILNKNDYETNEVKNIIQELVKKEIGFAEDYYYHKWVYIVTKLLYENRDSFTDPLKVIEEFYNNFGYPSEISDIIRYMTSNKSIPSNRKYNDNLLYSNWINYLKANEIKYKSFL